MTPHKKDERTAPRPSAPPGNSADKSRARTTGAQVKSPHESGTFSPDPSIFEELGSGVIRSDATPPHETLPRQTDGSSAPAAEPRRPDALRKPYASLPPPSAEAGAGSDFPAPLYSRAPAQRPSVYPAARPGSIPPGQLTPSVRPKNARTFCNRHQLAKNNRSECMMCQRELDKTTGGASWKVAVLLMAVSVAVGATIASLI